MQNSLVVNKTCRMFVPTLKITIMKTIQWTIGLVVGGMILTALFVGVIQG